jgi:multiple antibiotic resistance protein
MLRMETGHSRGEQTIRVAPMWWQQRFSEFVTLFLVVNPFGALPIFLTMAAGLDAPAQRKLALGAAVISLAVLVFFVFAGAVLLRQVGIPIRAFQISGGIVLFLVGLEMIRGHSYAGEEGTEIAGQTPFARAVYPLAVPLIAGPGAMLTVVLLTDDDRYNLPGQMITVVTIALVMVIQLMVLLAARPIASLIGMVGVSVVARVMGMLLAALAVSLVLSALGDWLALPKL